MPGYARLDDKRIRRNFFAAYNAAEAGSWANQIGVQMPSDTAIEDYRWLGAPPQMRQWLGGRLLKSVEVNEYTLKNEEYESTLDIPMVDLERDKTAQLNVRINDLAVKAATHWDDLATAIIVANGLTYDGQAFFSATHATGESGTHKNLVTATEIPSANVAGATPFIATPTEMANILPEMVQHMYSFKDERGDPINQNAQRFAVMVHPAQMGALNAALSLQFLGAGVSNIALGSPFKFFPIINPRLTVKQEVYMFRMDGNMRPLILQSEVPLRTSSLAEGSSEAFHNKRFLFGTYARRACGYGLWPHALKVTLS